MRQQSTATLSSTWRRESSDSDRREPVRGQQLAVRLPLRSHPLRQCFRAQSCKADPPTDCSLHPRRILLRIGAFDLARTNSLWFCEKASFSTWTFLVPSSKARRLHIVRAALPWFAGFDLKHLWTKAHHQHRHLLTKYGDCPSWSLYGCRFDYSKSNLCSRDFDCSKSTLHLRRFHHSAVVVGHFLRTCWGHNLPQDPLETFDHLFDRFACSQRFPVSVHRQLAAQAAAAPAGVAAAAVGAERLSAEPVDEIRPLNKSKQFGFKVHLTT